MQAHLAKDGGEPSSLELSVEQKQVDEKFGIQRAHFHGLRTGSAHDPLSSKIVRMINKR
jgi:hypothetical protein